MTNLTRQGKINVNVGNELEHVWRKAAHDLKNSFCLVDLNLASLKQGLGRLSTASKAKKDAEFHESEQTLADIIKEIRYCTWYLDLVTMKVKDLDYESNHFIEQGITNSVTKALANFLPLYALTDRTRIKNQVQDFNLVGNSQLLLHILYNLLGNTDYFMRDLARGEVFLTSAQDQNFNYLHFKDTGSGIAAEHLPHIFTQYFTTEKGRMGLGLYFCRKAMQVMHGNIECRTELGKFTEFTLSFPR